MFDFAKLWECDTACPPFAGPVAAGEVETSLEQYPEIPRLLFAPLGMTNGEDAALRHRIGVGADTTSPSCVEPAIPAFVRPEQETQTWVAQAHCFTDRWRVFAKQDGLTRVRHSPFGFLNRAP